MLYLYTKTVTPFQCEPPTIHSRSIEKENTFLRWKWIVLSN